jgi:dienelactone hydrolase
MPVNRRILLGAAAASVSLKAGVVFVESRVGELSIKHPDSRETAFRMMLPARPGHWPVVLFSHGANSSNADYYRLWSVWAARGYAVIGPNHIDTGPRDQQRKVGASELWRARVADTTLPLRQPAEFDAIARGLRGRLDWGKVCAAGHSFGAVVAQALAGATLLDPGDHTPFDGRAPAVAACMTFSPPGPLPGFIPSDAWKTVMAPSLLQTGDSDVLPGFVNDWRLRLTGFAGAADRWSIIGHGVDHYFGGLICRRKPGVVADLPALEETARLSSDFLDAYLDGRQSAVTALKARAQRGDDGVLVFAQA